MRLGVLGVGFFVFQVASDKYTVLENQLESLSGYCCDAFLVRLSARMV